MPTQQYLLLASFLAIKTTKEGMNWVTCQKQKKKKFELRAFLNSSKHLLYQKFLNRLYPLVFYSKSMNDLRLLVKRRVILYEILSNAKSNCVSNCWPLGPTSSNMKQNHLLLDSSENLPRIKSNQWSFHSIHTKLQYENRHWLFKWVTSNLPLFCNTEDLQSEWSLFKILNYKNYWMQRWHKLLLWMWRA